MPKKKTRKTRSIIEGHLEKIGSDAFDLYSPQISKTITGLSGVYALYKKDKLYYVGLAKNFKNRLKHHLKDRHARKWDTFSLYLTRKADHMRELEALLIRIADPKGNKQVGRLSKSTDLENTLKEKILEQQEINLERIFKKHRRPSSVHKATARHPKKRTSTVRHAESYSPQAGSFQAELLKAVKSGKFKRVDLLARKFNKRPGSIRGRLNAFERYGTISVTYSKDKSKVKVKFLVPVNWSGKKAVKKKIKQKKKRVAPYRFQAGSVQGQLLKFLCKDKPRNVKSTAKRFNVTVGRVRYKLASFSRAGIITYQYNENKSSVRAKFIVPVEWS